jgi:putative ABC transport system substrate-binding protein
MTTNRRRFLVASGAGLALAPLIARAQQASSKVPRIGVLVYTGMTEVLRESFRQGLRDHGYVEGQSILVEWRAADGRPERAKALAAELVEMKVDVIVAVLTPAIQAARGATGTIPIVMAPGGDPVRLGFVASLARPGGNITGVTGLADELSGKRLQLLREIAPGANRVAVLLNEPDPFAKPFLAEHEAATRKIGIQLQVEAVRKFEEVDAALARMAREHSAAVVVQPSLASPAARASQIAKLALQLRLIAISQSGEFADAGGLMSYGASFPSLHRRAAFHVDRILRGAKPSDLPVEQATKFELVINMKTAKALGLTIPQSILVRADRVIE